MNVRGPGLCGGVAFRGGFAKGCRIRQFLHLEKAACGSPGAVGFVMESLILAQNERWRHGLGMQVERVKGNFDEWRKGEERVRNLPLKPE